MPTQENLCQAVLVSGTQAMQAGRWCMLQVAAQPTPIMSLLHHSHTMETAAANFLARETLCGE